MNASKSLVFPVSIAGYGTEEFCINYNDIISLKNTLSFLFLQFFRSAFGNIS